MSVDWSAAVAEVELDTRHEHECEYAYWLRDRNREGIDPFCTCRRAERVAVRIAKGIEAALDAYGTEVADDFSDGLISTANAAALAAFKETT